MFEKTVIEGIAFDHTATAVARPDSCLVRTFVEADAPRVCCRGHGVTVTRRPGTGTAPARAAADQDRRDLVQEGPQVFDGRRRPRRRPAGVGGPGS